MRRAFQGLSAGGVLLACLLTAAPAHADGNVGWTGDGDGETGTVDVKASQPGGIPSPSGGGNSAPADNTDNVPADLDSGSAGRGNSGSGGRSDAESSLPEYHTLYYDPRTGESWAGGAGSAPARSDTPIPFVDGVSTPPEEPAPAAEEPPAEGEQPPQVDPGTVAQYAVAQMGLEAPEIASTPNDPDTLGAVGLPVWFWVANPGATTTGPQTVTATAGSVSVTATATFTGMTIDAGDGTSIACDGPGTEYPGTGTAPSPDCGHTYQTMSDDQEGGTYTVTTTAHWSVGWEGAGQSGTIPIDLTTSKQLRIGQYQTVVTTNS